MSLTLMSLPCFVLIVSSTMRPSANGQPVFRRGLGFHITVTMGVWLWGSLFCCNPLSLWLAAVRNPVIRTPEKRLFSGSIGGGEDPSEIARSRANRSLISLFSTQDGSSGNGIGSQPHGRFVVLVPPCFFRVSCGFTRGGERLS
jgi:hypothetical protein